MRCLILGASARAAVQSAFRAGLRPLALDLFADRDLIAIAPARRIRPESYPDGLARLAEDSPPGPWLYTGALENHPDLIDRIAEGRPLWGNPGAVLRAVRDPSRFADALRRAGLPGPAVRRAEDGPPREGTWLVKPLASAGGLGIRRLDPSGGPPPPGHYLQERIDGPSFSAVFVGHPPEARLLGVTRQWIGPVGDHEFAYRGSLGPWPLPAGERDRVERLGRAVASAFGLIGLFGIDFILRDGDPWPLEVNPRYTASVEVLELASGRSLLAEHVRACLGEPAGRPVSSSGRRQRPAAVGKVIVYASRPVRFPTSIPWRPRFAPDAVPTLADVPYPGTPFRAGEPVLTLLARGATTDNCRRRLECRLARWEGRLAGCYDGRPPRL